MRKFYKLETVIDFFNKEHEKIDGVKFTSFKILGFNEMEGYQYIVNFKMFMKKPYKNKILPIVIYSGDFDYGPVYNMIFEDEIFEKMQNEEIEWDNNKIFKILEDNLNFYLMNFSD